MLHALSSIPMLTVYLGDIYIFSPMFLYLTVRVRRLGLGYDRVGFILIISSPKKIY